MTGSKNVAMGAGCPDSERMAARWLSEKWRQVVRARCERGAECKAMMSIETMCSDVMW